MAFQLEDLVGVGRTLWSFLIAIFILFVVLLSMKQYPECIAPVQLSAECTRSRFIMTIGNADHGETTHGTRGCRGMGISRQTLKHQINSHTKRIACSLRWLACCCLLVALCLQVWLYSQASIVAIMLCVVVILRRSRFAQACETPTETAQSHGLALDDNAALSRDCTLLRIGSCSLLAMRWAHGQLHGQTFLALTLLCGSAILVSIPKPLGRIVKSCNDGFTVAQSFETPTETVQSHGLAFHSYFRVMHYHFRRLFAIRAFPQSHWLQHCLSIVQLTQLTCASQNAMLMSRIDLLFAFRALLGELLGAWFCSLQLVAFGCCALERSLLDTLSVVMTVASQNAQCIASESSRSLSAHVLDVDDSELEVRYARKCPGDTVDSISIPLNISAHLVSKCSVLCYVLCFATYPHEMSALFALRLFTRHSLFVERIFVNAARLIINNCHHCFSSLYHSRGVVLHIGCALLLLICCFPMQHPLLTFCIGLKMPSAFWMAMLKRCAFGLLACIASLMRRSLRCKHSLTSSNNCNNETSNENNAAPQPTQ